jgi:hypothetical protein
VPVLQPAPGVVVRCVCVQEAEAARTLQAQGTIAELQRQLVSGTRRVQHGSVCALCADFCGVGSVPVLQPAPGVAVRWVCVQEAEAARTLQAQGTIAELQRQLVSGTTRTQNGGLRALFAVMCVCTDRIQHGALGCGWCVVQAQARATPVAAAVAAAAPPPPPVAGGAAVGAAAAAAGATPAVVRARCAVCGAAVLGGRVSVGGADSGVMACALVAWRPLAACVAAFTHALYRGPVSMK